MADRERDPQQKAALDAVITRCGGRSTESNEAEELGEQSGRIYKGLGAAGCLDALEAKTSCFAVVRRFWGLRVRSRKLGSPRG